MNTETQKAKEIGWKRRTNRLAGFGADSIPRELPYARKQFDHMPYGSLGDPMPCLDEEVEDDDMDW